MVTKATLHESTLNPELLAKLNEFAQSKGFTDATQLPAKLWSAAEVYVGDSSGKVRSFLAQDQDGTAGSANALKDHLPKMTSTPHYPGSSKVVSTKPVDPADAKLADTISHRIGVCPAMKFLFSGGGGVIRNEAENPVGRIKDVIDFGDSGGGNLGSKVLSRFAVGNHHNAFGVSGQLDTPVPPNLDMFGLNLADSKGAGGPGGEGTGRSGIFNDGVSGFLAGREQPSIADWNRLQARATDAAGVPLGPERIGTTPGYLPISQFGKFLAENLDHDPTSKVASLSVLGLLTKDLGGVLGAIVPLTVELIANKLQGKEGSEAHTAFLDRLTKLAGENSLFKTSGEFGLLYALLANSPRTKKIDGELALNLDEVKNFFLNKQLPSDWKDWPKWAGDWIRSTVGLATATGKEYAELKHS